MPDLVEPVNIQECRATLAILDHTSPSFASDARHLAEKLLPVLRKNHIYWESGAQLVLAALIMWTVLEAHGVVKPFVIDKFHKHRTVPTIARVRELLCQASGENKKTGLVYGLPALSRAMMLPDYPELRNRAGSFTNWDRTTQGVVVTARYRLDVFGDVVD